MATDSFLPPPGLSNEWTMLDTAISLLMLIAALPAAD